MMSLMVTIPPMPSSVMEHADLGWTLLSLAAGVIIGLSSTLILMIKGWVTRSIKTLDTTVGTLTTQVIEMKTKLDDLGKLKQKADDGEYVKTKTCEANRAICAGQKDKEDRDVCGELAALRQEYEKQLEAHICESKHRSLTTNATLDRIRNAIHWLAENNPQAYPRERLKELREELGV